MDIKIRIALPEDSLILTEIAFSAKRTWDYPESYFEIWKDELTIKEEYIRNNIVLKAIVNEDIAGFISVVEVPEDFTSGKVFVGKGFWVEHIFIRPEYQQKGIGSKLLEKTCSLCIEKGIEILKIFVDPYAEGFYKKEGAEFIYESPSSIEGRNIPVYQINCKSGHKNKGK